MFKPQNILSQKATQLILAWFKSTTQYYNLELNLFRTKFTTKTSEHHQWPCAGVFQILWVLTHTMFKHTQTICWLLLTNCLGVFKHFVGFVLQRLKLLNISHLVLAFLLILNWRQKKCWFQYWLHNTQQTITVKVQKLRNVKLTWAVKN